MYINVHFSLSKSEGKNTTWFMFRFQIYTLNKIETVFISQKMVLTFCLASGSTSSQGGIPFPLFRL